LALTKKRRIVRSKKSKGERRAKPHKKSRKVRRRTMIWHDGKPEYGTKRDVEEVNRVWQSLIKRGVVS